MCSIEISSGHGCEADGYAAFGYCRKVQGRFKNHGGAFCQNRRRALSRREQAAATTRSTWPTEASERSSRKSALLAMFDRTRNKHHPCEIRDMMKPDGLVCIPKDQLPNFLFKLKLIDLYLSGGNSSSSGSRPMLTSSERGSPPRRIGRCIPGRACSAAGRRSVPSRSAFRAACRPASRRIRSSAT